MLASVTALLPINIIGRTPPAREAILNVLVRILEGDSVEITAFLQMGDVNCPGELGSQALALFWVGTAANDLTVVVVKGPCVPVDYVLARPESAAL